MRLLLWTSLVMLAFAANSVLNRLAIRVEGMDPLAFAALRLGAGAVVLLVLAQGRTGPLMTKRRLVGTAGLLAYMLGFSLAYRQLDAGTGALILFGVVQLTMFAMALGAERVPANRILGALIAFAGLVWLVWPGAGARVDLAASGAMAVAGIGWAVYSLVGRRETAPLSATAASFALAALPAALVAFGFAAGPVGAGGLVLAVLSGAVTSGLGYALWYRVLPQLGTARAAVAQLTVPPLALGLGVLFLAERPGVVALAATAVILLGVGVSLVRVRP
ncbi:DMT family transporter [Tabrizicola oligotrophica]|uniref:DMT family transporter n=1 Tax=Tabrizicola oligotrophica TaxID=2710650 RepID=A0A6M0QW50_9RHOB|nr:DMT family transporter [Tabrizicola oligotrophica]NEY91627.1 DMT family transporter [Tabrizicola oligotrophica]